MGNLENVGYARPGKEGLYNVLIMDERHSILATGAGASTKLVTGGGEWITRIHNYKYPAEYLGGFSNILERKRKVAEFYEIRQPNASNRWRRAGVNELALRDAATLIGDGERYYHRNVSEVADYLFEHHGSVSDSAAGRSERVGKTTTARKISALLQQKGMQAPVVRSTISIVIRSDLPLRGGWAAGL